MTGTPEGSTESGFMEKPGIEHATPGLQGIALIHYTTGALCVYLMTGATEGSTEGQKQVNVTFSFLNPFIYW